MTADPRAAFTVEGLRSAGFVGFLDVDTLTLSELPAVPGVYVICTATKPTFRRASPAGAFRGDPSVPVDVLEDSWVEGATLIYIGKATNVRSRVRAYLSHGRGGSGRHWGGRYVWQADYDDLVIAWRETPDPRAIEKRMIASFILAHGKRPFANLTG